MLKILIQLKLLFFNNKTAYKIVGIYIAINSVIAAVFYPLIPLLMNYPAGTVGGKFQMELEGANYTVQYIMILLVIFFCIYLFILLQMKDVSHWESCLLQKDPFYCSKLRNIRKKCISLPYTIYIAQIIIPSVFIIIIHAITTGKINVTTIKLWIVFFSFITMSAVLSLLLSKGIFIRILLGISDHCDEIGKRFGLKRKIFLQMVPLFIVAILFTSFIGYSRLVKEKGDLLFKVYKGRMEERFTTLPKDMDFDKVKGFLHSIQMESSDDSAFIISPEGKIFYDGSGQISSFFLKHLHTIALKQDGHVYEYYGVDIQGVAMRIRMQDATWIIGIRYIVSSVQMLVFFLASFVILFGLNTFVLFYFTKTMTEDVSRVTKSLLEITNGINIDLNKNLLVTSNDEIGDLVMAFNHIQQREKENLETIKENQAILIEQERLASLGQLIGGIAHNLKTPIMSLAGGIEALKDLIREYEESIGDPQITAQDHKDIADEMNSWLEKMKPYCSYMSDVISAVKGQAVQMNSVSSNKFTIDELVKRVDLLMKHELKKYHCVLNTDFQIDMNTEIKGEVNNLVQVFDNIIINAVQAYEGKSGTIDFRIMRIGDNVEFTFRDYAKGIPVDIADRLFKEMVTTKGKNGTGLGLYMSYSTIKGRFGGNMSFHSREGGGTTFLISIPCIVYNKQEVSA